MAGDSSGAEGSNPQSRSFQGITVDEVGFIQIADAKVLAAVARGEIDLNLIAREELAARGLGIHGEWVGFEKARTIHGLDK